MAVISNRVAFWDGDNFVIVTKKCSKEQARKILAALAAADLDDVEMAPESAAEPVYEPEEEEPTIPEDVEQSLTKEEVPDEPVQDTREEAVRFTGKTYTGMTPYEVLREHKGKGFGNLTYLRAKTKHPELAEAIEKAQKRYFKETFSTIGDPYKNVARWNKERCEDFFRFFAGIMDDSDKDSVVQSAGSATFEDFLKDASHEQLQSLAATVIEKYIR